MKYEYHLRFHGSTISQAFERMMAAATHGCSFNYANEWQSAVLRRHCILFNDSITDQETALHATEVTIPPRSFDDKKKPPARASSGSPV
jgi:hypothetical protein